MTPRHSIPRLGINLDHIATLRQLRNTPYPSLELATLESFEAGADQITLHLREDERHIQRADIPLIRQLCQKHHKIFNLEMALGSFVEQVAFDVSPDWICLVPEKREEKTTEGGLDILNPFIQEKIFQFCSKLSKNIKVSLFIEAKTEYLPILKTLLSAPIHAVEIHTGDYAHLWEEQKNNFSDSERKLQLQHCLESFSNFAKEVASLNLSYHAGHGISLKNLPPLVSLHIFQEYNIGHAVICDAVFCGLKQAIKQFKQHLTPLITF